MTKLRTASITLSALILVSASHADSASAIRRVLQDENVQAKTVSWTLPFAFDANLHPRGGFASVGEYYANYHGREMQMREFLAGVNITDVVKVWFASQAFVAKGRHSGNRFHVSDDVYGAKWVFKPAREAGDPSVAVEFQATRPGTASATTSNAAVTFNATKDNFFAIDYGLPSGLQTQFSYTSIKGAADGNANVFGLAGARDMTLREKLNLRLQANLIAQGYKDVSGNETFNFRPVLYAALGYEVANGLRLEGDASVMPFGVPLGGTHFQGLSGFEIYNPTGVAGELKDNMVAFASLRLVFHGKF